MLNESVLNDQWLNYQMTGVGYWLRSFIIPHLITDNSTIDN